MQTPFQLTFRNAHHSNDLAAHLQKRADRLDNLFDRVTSCHVVIELAGHHHRHGDHYRVCVNVGLPGHELNVTHDPPEDRERESVRASADLAFDEAERQLGHWITRQRRQRHQAPPARF